MYKSEEMVFREKEISRISAIEKNNFRGFLGYKKIDSELRCVKGVGKGMIKVFSSGLTILKEEILILIKVYRRGHLWEDIKRLECEKGGLTKRMTAWKKKKAWMVGKQGEWCMTKMNERGL